MTRYFLIIIFLFFLLFNISANEKTAENIEVNKYNTKAFIFKFNFNQNKLYENIHFYSDDEEGEKEYSDESCIGQVPAWAILFPFSVGFAFANNNEYQRYPSEDNSEKRAWAWGAFGAGLAILTAAFIIFLTYSLITEDFIVAAIGSTVLTGLYFITSMVSIGLYVDSVINFFKYRDYYKEFCVYSFSANLGVLGFFTITTIIYWILYAEWPKPGAVKQETNKNNQLIFDGQTLIFKF